MHILRGVEADRSDVIMGSIRAVGSKTSIEWTATVHADGSVTPGSTWTPIRARNNATGKVGWHCENVSEGCRHCYAEGLNRRLGTGLDFKPGHRNDITIFLDEKMLVAPLHWRKPRKIFVCSMTDLFAEFVPDEFIDRVFAVMALSPRHVFQVLSKRPERMLAYVTDRDVSSRVGTAMAEMWKAPLASGEWPLQNVWLGTSVEDQERADERIPLLLQTPAAVRFISAEPLLGPIDLTRYLAPAFSRCQNDGSPAVHQIARAAAGRFGGLNYLDQIIVGGESGQRARPMNPQWARDLRDQCARAGTPFFMKQIDKKQPIPADLMVREFPQ